MKLFAVGLPDRTLLTDADGQPVYYSDKMDAKRIRDRLNGATIVLGPDHHRYNTCVMEN